MMLAAKFSIVVLLLTGQAQISSCSKEKRKNFKTRPISSYKEQYYGIYKTKNMDFLFYTTCIPR